MIDPKIEILRRFIAAGLCDLIGYLDRLDMPIVVGGDYPKDRLVQAFGKWCKDRNVSVADADGAGWLAACKGGSLTPPLPLPIVVEPESEPEPEPEPGTSYFKSDGWKLQGEQDNPWHEQGEDWKDGGEDACT